VQDIETDREGVTDYTYMISDDHGFVDLLTTQGDPGVVAGISINGGAGVKMSPIMGVRLGDSAFVVLTQVGQPDHKERISGSDATLWSYDGRNYAFKVSSGGDIIGIRIYAYSGMQAADPQAPSAPVQD
jgi:hypothetical protein